jgi:hypothetical protein
MDEPTVPLRKASGGCSVLGYMWPEDGAVVDVGYADAMTLLAIPDADFSVADVDVPKHKPAKAEPEAETGTGVTEPGPVADITEPAPQAGAEVTEPRPQSKPDRRNVGRGTTTKR